MTGMDRIDKARMEADFELAPGERWYLAHTLPHKESSVEQRLQVQGFRHFMPRRIKTVRHARRMRNVLAPVFPRYVFVVLDLEHDRWRSVNGTIGIASLFMAQDRPLPVPHGVVETLIQSSDNRGQLRFVHNLRLGQKVRLMSGPFSEALGSLERLDDSGRIEVLLEIMGGQVRTKLRREQVEPVI
ncbi:transcriptional antiterminator RfaH [Methylosinus sp. sav-2]|uniref:transcription termination/antitermination protein NusG n=1 Tax=Methylosinus sp. sav-2 TaxID=2485168 RepID=UPI000A003AC4|nr:transcription termination/antitermination NusG family protein [Methylosinus sp. sav-2]TDX62137.1 transcriptional antiterminator RfaH [Methylosinus sp. sav-2]